MGLVVGPDPGLRQAILDTAVHPEMDPVTEARLAGHPAMTWNDVEDMHGFLTRWSGDLRSMLGDVPGPGRGPMDG